MDMLSMIQLRGMRYDISYYYVFKRLHWMTMYINKSVIFRILFISFLVDVLPLARLQPLSTYTAGDPRDP